MNKKARSVVNRLFVAWAACEIFICSAAFAAPIPAGLDSFETLYGSEQNFNNGPIPADFFDPGSDPFGDIIGFQGVPLGPGATTDTLVERLDRAKLTGPLPSSDTVPIQIVALSLASVSPITVSYDGGARTELWDVQVELSATPQPLGTMTIRKEAKSGGSFDWVLPVLPRLTFVRASDGATRVLDYGALGLPSLDLGARVVPWTPNSLPETIHAKNFCPGCDSPDGVPVEIFASGNFVQYIFFPASTAP